MARAASLARRLVGSVASTLAGLVADGTSADGTAAVPVALAFAGRLLELSDMAAMVRAVESSNWDHLAETVNSVTKTRPKVIGGTVAEWRVPICTEAPLSHTCRQQIGHSAAKSRQPHIRPLKPQFVCHIPLVSSRPAATWVPLAAASTDHCELRLPRTAQHALAALRAQVKPSNGT